MSGRPNVSHAKARALVTAPGLVPGTTITGRLYVLTRRHARIRLASGAWVTRDRDQVRLAPEPPTAPRSLP